MSRKSLELGLVYLRESIQSSQSNPARILARMQALFEYIGRHDLADWVDDMLIQNVDICYIQNVIECLSDNMMQSLNLRRLPTIDE
jgi:hypothetical protein